MAQSRQLDMVRKPRDITRPAPVVDSAPTPRLAKKRRKYRRQILVALVVVLLILFGVVVWGIWQPMLRIQHVSISGSDAFDLEPMVDAALAGTYFHILPHNSIFFAPTGKIRRDILAVHAELGAVSISRTSLSSLAVTVLPRINAYSWCGTDDVTATSTVSAEPDFSAPCYETDPEGLIFAPVPTTTASSTIHIADMPLQTVRIYAPVDSSSPIRAHLVAPDRIPVALQLARTLGGIGAEPISFVVRGDEGDFFLASGTRITFVLGDESAAAQRAAAAFPQLNLSDGSVQYVDLRFDGKVYVKKAASK